MAGVAAVTAVVAEVVETVSASSEAVVEGVVEAEATAVTGTVVDASATAATDAVSEAAGDFVANCCEKYILHFCIGGCGLFVAGFIATLAVLGGSKDDLEMAKLTLDFNVRAEGKQELSIDADDAKENASIMQNYRETDFSAYEKKRRARIIENYAHIVCKQMDAMYGKSRMKLLNPHISQLTRQAGNDAVTWCKDQGNHIKEIGLIPIYGWIKAGVLLGHLKSQTKSRFRTMTQSSITRFLHSNAWAKEKKALFDKNFKDFRTTPLWHEIMTDMQNATVGTGASIGTGEYLISGQRLISASGVFQAVVQCDGNFVVYEGKPNSDPIWNSNTCGKGTGPFKLIMQGDGNLVMYDSIYDGHEVKQQPIWASNTCGKGTAPFKLVMQDDGNLVLYQANGSTWATNTCREAILGTGKSLGSNQSLDSTSGVFRAVMQGDGNFVIYKNQGNSQDVIWTSSTCNKGPLPCKLTMQDDGNLVIYNKNNQSTWASNTCGQGTSPFKLVMQNDGNLVIYQANGKSTWATNT